MSPRLIRSTLFVLVAATMLVARPPQSAADAPLYLPSSEPNAQKLLADRIRFVREMYQCDQATIDKVSKDFAGLVAFQEKYVKDSSKSLYRLELAINIVANDPNIAADQRAERIGRFQGQMGGVYARAPLSLANVMKTVEGNMTSDKIEAARKRIAGKLGARLKGAPLDPSKVDGLFAPPIEPGKRPEITAAMSKTTLVQAPVAPPMPAVQSTQVEPAKPSLPFPLSPAPQPQPSQTSPPRTTPSPQAPAVKPPVVAPTPPPPPPRILVPAPPEAEWTANAEKAASRYGFSADQRKVAAKAAEQCKARASAHRESYKSAYDEAAKMPEGKPKADKLGDLNKVLDAAYDEMLQRVDSIATLEQRAKVAKSEPPKN